MLVRGHVLEHDEHFLDPIFTSHSFPALQRNNWYHDIFCDTDAMIQMTQNNNRHLDLKMIGVMSRINWEHPQLINTDVERDWNRVCLCIYPNCDHRPLSRLPIYIRCVTWLPFMWIPQWAWAWIINGPSIFFTHGLKWENTHTYMHIHTHTHHNSISTSSHTCTPDRHHYLESLNT